MAKNNVYLLGQMYIYFVYCQIWWDRKVGSYSVYTALDCIGTLREVWERRDTAWVSDIWETSCSFTLNDGDWNLSWWQALATSLTWFIVESPVMSEVLGLCLLRNLMWLLLTRTWQNMLWFWGLARSVVIVRSRVNCIDIEVHGIERDLKLRMWLDNRLYIYIQVRR